MFEELYLESKIKVFRDCHRCQDYVDYNLELKCCTYQPKIANFLIGAAFNDKSLTLDCELIFTPLAVLPSLDYDKKFSSATPQQYGQDRDLKCSFFEDGNCQIYPYRNGTCRSFYCALSPVEKNSIEEESDIYFKREMGIAQLIALELGVLWPEVEQNLSFINTPSASQLEKLSLVNVEYYKECFQVWQKKKHDFIKSVQNDVIQ